ncbi:hypothetical protein CC79DRAFT_1364157 [Sarocladium strictum]
MAPPDRRAYVEDAEEDTGSSIEGDENTRAYATSQAPPPTPPQRSNTSKSRGSRPPAERSGSSSASLVDAETDSTTRSSKQSMPLKPSSGRKDSDQRPREAVRRRRERPSIDARERNAPDSGRPPKEAQVPRSARPPPPQHAATQPIINNYQTGFARPNVEDASYYGIQPATSGPVRPGNRRPASYYAGQPPRPPVSNPSWHQPPPFPVGTFPPPMYPPSPMMHAPMPPHPPPPGMAEPQGYFDPSLDPSMQSRDRLKARFQQRPSSAMGGRPPSSMGFPPPEYDEPLGRPITRRPSQSGRRERDRDRQDMPPPTWVPQRSNSAMPVVAPFRPPPQNLQPSPLRQQRPSNANRRSVGFADQRTRGFADDDLIGEDDLFHDISPQPPRMKPQRGSQSYGHGDYELVLAERNSRRSSIHGAAISGGGASLEEDPVEAAMRYQDRMNGGKVPLTEKVLREASKRGGVPSSRSTRSSASHDDSEYYKRSNTTGFTRSSGGGGDDYKFKVSGAAIVRDRASGLEIECEGGEIIFSAGPSRSRSGSERGSTIFPQLEDSQSRMGQRALAYRGRAPSQSDSQSRGYAPTHAPYEPHLANYL